MKISDQDLEKLLLKSFDLLDKTKDTCKITISQCLQSNMANQYLTNAVVKSCLETIDTADLLKTFITNRSPNINDGIHLILKVFDVNIDECKKLSNEKACKEMINYCIGMLKETKKTIQKLHDVVKE